MDDLNVLPVILVGNERKSAQSVCVTIRGCLALRGCTILYPSLKRRMFRVCEGATMRIFSCAMMRKLWAEALGSVLKGRTEIGVIDVWIFAHE